MKKVILTLLLAAFSLGTFAETSRQDTTKRRKDKRDTVKRDKQDTLKKDNMKKWPDQRDTTRKTY